MPVDASYMKELNQWFTKKLDMAPFWLVAEEAKSKCSRTWLRSVGLHLVKFVFYILGMYQCPCKIVRLYTVRGTYLSHLDEYIEDEYTVLCIYLSVDLPRLGRSYMIFGVWQLVNFIEALHERPLLFAALIFCNMRALPHPR
ncbi:hypothetical protein OROMI_002737 [Orobanche minor]